MSLQGLDMYDKRMKILQYVESKMAFIAPNLSTIVGSTVAAKMMGEWAGTYTYRCDH